MTDAIRPLPPSLQQVVDLQRTRLGTYELRRLEQILASVQLIDESNCWTFGGYRARGYGRASFRGKDVSAHRLVYELLRAVVPAGLQLDHLCHTRDEQCPGGYSCPHRACVNPDHLEIVTCQENVLRSRGLAAQFAKKTHCPLGHPYSGDNLYQCKDYRACKECWRINARKRYHRKKQQGGES